jgi:predicted nucleotidyltransferase
MTWLLPEQIAALAELQTICDRLGAAVVIIGAAAYRAWFEDPHRYTEDVDVAVAVDLEQLAKLGEALTQIGWRQEPRWEQRWRSPAGARIDLLPAGGTLRAGGRVEWPRSGMTMSLAGFEHVFADAQARRVAPETVLQVAPVPVLALLKVASFLDSPHARAKDAQDVFSMLERYEIDGDRRFDGEVSDAGIDYDCSGAFLLGKDVRALCTAAETELPARFIRLLEDESTPEALIVERVTGESRRSILAAFAAGFSRVG